MNYFKKIIKKWKLIKKLESTLKYIKSINQSPYSSSYYETITEIEAIEKALNKLHSL